MDLDRVRPPDRRLDLVYRFGAAMTGLVLVGFGGAGLVTRLPLFDTQGEVIAGVATNGALSFISLAVGSLLVGASVIGGKFASTVSLLVGVAFVGSGFVHLVLMNTNHNVFAFSMPNVICSFVVGLAIMYCGMDGRFSGGLPEDNPFRRHRERQKTPPGLVGKPRWTVRATTFRHG
ncbi:DUF4383 domain-containing protein [Spiractinospora alimapuensis]|uniref:DUF4383 domain-containing protein n=1 Tax=Spiractinospora alimapuensis TaxID=2820884 RepID=UPI001F47FEEE|nr:DUF4383 domain-containing protein [Spiractinospora alimapuensis]